MYPVPEKDVRKLAKKSDHKWAHHVALLYSGGCIVAVGFNKGEMHAEEMAIRKLQMAGGTATRMRSMRIRRDGKIGASKPCEDCLKSIISAGIKQVYYHDYDGVEQRMILG